jgi:hypothetical protein
MIAYDGEPDVATFERLVRAIEEAKKLGCRSRPRSRSRRPRRHVYLAGHVLGKVVLTIRR